MTLSAINPLILYYGNGSTTVFPVGFQFIETSDLAVTLIDAAGVRTLQSLGSHYTVAGGDFGTGTVTMTAAPAAGTKLEIRRATPRTQPMDYTPGDDFPAESHEKALDREMMVSQEIEAYALDLGARALRVPSGETVPELPAAASRASRVFSWDVLGLPSMSSLATLAASLVGFLTPLLPGNLVGSPGGNVMSVGPFTSIPTMTIPAGTNAIYTSSYDVLTREGGARYVEDTTLTDGDVAAQPRVYAKSANGRYWKLAYGYGIHLEQAGGKCDCPVTTFTYTNFTASWAVPGGITDNSAALMALLVYGKTRAIGTVNEGGPMVPILAFGNGDSAKGYFFGSTPVPPWSFHLVGTHSGNDTYDGVGTTFLFPPNTGGLICNHWGTQPGGYALIGTGGSVIEGIDFRGGGGTDRTKHGIWHRVPITLRNCTFRSFSGNNTNNVGSVGYAMSDPRFGLTSGTRYERVFCAMAGNWNSYTSGSDVSASTYILLHHKGSRLGGLYDDGYFASEYVGYFNQQHGDGHVGACWHAGANYALISPIPGIGAATTPGTNEAVWEWRGLAGAASTNWPAWSAAATYEMSLPVYMSGQGGRLQGYTENYYLPSHFPTTAGNGTTVSGTVMTTRTSATWGKLDNPVSLSSLIPLTWARSYSPNEAAYATLGTDAHAGLGGTGTTFGFHYRAAEGYTYKHEWIGSDIVYSIGGVGSGLPVIWQISGSGAGARQFGTGAALKGAFNPNILVIGDGNGNNDNGRRAVMGTAAPTSGAHAKGERVLNSNSTVGQPKAWECTAAGVPGTWVSEGNL